MGETCTDRPWRVFCWPVSASQGQDAAVFVVVADVFREPRFPMAFIESDDGFQQVATAAKEHSRSLASRIAKIALSPVGQT